MDYHLYLHDDMDGVSSGALFLHFFRLRGDGISHYYPVDFGNGFKEKWPDFRLEHPAVVVDFLYHPEADWWLDHHVSSFVKPMWQENFVADKQHSFAPNEKSCAGQVYRFLEREYNVRWPGHFKSWVDLVDMGDSATWPTIEAALDLDSPIHKFSTIIDNYIEDETRIEYIEFKKQVIEVICAGQVENFISSPEFKLTLDKGKLEQEKSFEIVRNNFKLEDKVAVAREIPENLHEGTSRFIPFAVFPTSKYQALVMKTGGAYKLRMSKNPWTKGPWPLNLGAIAHELQVGGGGHDGIGIMRFTEPNLALQKLDEIITLLNTDG